VDDRDVDLLFRTLFDIRSDVRDLIDLLVEDDDGSGEEEEG
jgi:hypothetical protein